MKGEIKGQFKSTRTNLVDFLELKYGEDGVRFAREFENVNDPSELQSVLKASYRANSLDEIRSLLN